MTNVWSEIVEIAKKFYIEKGRMFPWRSEKDFFKVLVAEMLLQKTPADRCVDIYEKILQKYPSCEALASASEKELKSLFSRLGLFKRAQWLKEACALVSRGSVPFLDEKKLKELKGVGDYTSRAIVIVLKGYGRLPIDANIRRILTRLGIPKDTWNDLKLSREAFYGLVDLAATVCKNKEPKCESCPLNTHCTFAKVKSGLQKSN